MRNLISSGDSVDIVESALTHPARPSGLVMGGDPVVVGALTGAAEADAQHSTDTVVVVRRGVIEIPVVGVDATGDSAVAPGDQLFIDPATAIVSKNASHQPYGIAIGGVFAGATTNTYVLLSDGGSPTVADVDAGGASVLHAATVAVSSADLLALFATPKVLVAAPGAGKLLVPISVVYQFTPGATPYDVSGGGAVQVSVGGNGSGIGGAITNANGLLTGAVGAVASGAQTAINGGGAWDTDANVRDQPIHLFNVGPGEYTNGDGAMVVTVAYLIVNADGTLS